jgi:hypothetical protein
MPIRVHSWLRALVPMPSLRVQRFPLSSACMLLHGRPRMDGLRPVRCQQDDKAGGKADGDEALAELGSRVFKGLRSINVVANTGMGRTLDLAAAREVLSAAMRDRGKLFRAPQRRELEDWVRSCRHWSDWMDEEGRIRPPEAPRPAAQLPVRPLRAHQQGTPGPIWHAE